MITLPVTFILSEFYPDKKIEIENVPDHKTVKERGVSVFLLKPKE